MLYSQPCDLETPLLASVGVSCQHQSTDRQEIQKKLTLAFHQIRANSIFMTNLNTRQHVTLALSNAFQTFGGGVSSLSVSVDVYTVPVCIVLRNHPSTNSNLNVM